MTDKRKARTTAATVERAAGTVTLGTAAVADADFNAKVSGGQAISALLSHGAENGLTLGDLVCVTGLNERVIRARIQAERKAGVLILSDCQHGYFLPTSENEVRRFIRSMSHRAREISVISCAAEDALVRLTGQEQIGGWQT